MNEAIGSIQQQFQILSNASERGDSTLEAAWESLFKILSSFSYEYWSTIHHNIPTEMLLNIRRFFINMFPSSRLRLRALADKMDHFTLEPIMTMQSRQIFQLLKAFIDCLFKWCRIVTEESEWRSICFIFNPIFQACIRRDIWFSMCSDGSEYSVLLDDILHIVTEESTSQSMYYRVLILLQMLILLNNYSYHNGRPQRNNVSLHIANMVRSMVERGDFKEFSMIMSIPISQLSHSSHHSTSSSANDWLDLSMKIYFYCVGGNVTMELINKKIYHSLHSMSVEANDNFISALVRSQFTNKHIPTWIYFKWAIMSYVSSRLTKKCVYVMDNISVYHDWSVSIEKSILDLLVNRSVEIDPHFEVDALLDNLIGDESHLYNSNYKNEIKLLSEMSGEVLKCFEALNIEDDKNPSWPYRSTFIEFLQRIFLLKGSMLDAHIKLAIISICDTIFTTFRDLRNDIVLLLLDYDQYETTCDSFQEVSGPLLLYMCRKAALINDEISESLTSSLIHMIEGKNIPFMKPWMTKFVIRTLAFSSNGRLWIFNVLLPDLHCFSYERRRNAVIGLVALVESGSIPKFLSDQYTMHGLLIACEVIQAEAMFLDIILDIKYSYLDTFTKDRLGTSILISILHHFQGNWDPDLRDNEFIFLPHSLRLENLPLLMKALIKLLPDEAMISYFNGEEYERKCPHYVIISISCIRSIICFLESTEPADDSKIQNTTNSPGLDNLKRIEETIWASKLPNISITASPNASLANSDITCVATFPLAIRFSLGNTMIESLYQSRYNFPHLCDSSFRLSIAMNMLLRGILSLADMEQNIHAISQRDKRVPSFHLFWKHTKYDFRNHDFNFEGLNSDEREYISSLIGTIRLVSLYHIHVVQFNSFSSIDLSRIFIDVYFVHSHIVRAMSYFADLEDGFNISVKKNSIDLMNAILSSITNNKSSTTTVEMDQHIFDLPYIGLLISNICNELKISCEGRYGGMNTGLMRSYVNMLIKLIGLIEEKELYKRSLSSTGELIIKLNIASLLLVEVIFSCSLTTRTLKAMSQLSIYKVPKLVNKMKQELIVQEVDSERDQELGTADPILVASVLSKSLSSFSSSNAFNNESHRNSCQYIALFCIDCIGKLWMESCNLKNNNTISSIQVANGNFPLLRYYKDRYYWYQTLLHSVWNCIEKSDEKWPRSFIDAISMSSSRIFNSLRICCTHFTRQLGQQSDSDTGIEDSLWIVESYLILSSWVSFSNTFEDATLFKMLNVRKLKEQEPKEDSLIVSFHSCIRKLAVQLQKYENHPSTVQICVFAQEVLGISNYRLLDELTTYLERVGIKLSKSRDSYQVKSESKRSRNIKRSRNQLIDEWLEVDRERHDDYEDLEDFLLPG